jgi:hypothetical protein
MRKPLVFRVLIGFGLFVTVLADTAAAQVETPEPAAPSVSVTKRSSRRCRA